MFQLPVPLYEVLQETARVLRDGRKGERIVGPPSDYNALFAAHHAAALGFLRKEFERVASMRTIREADSTLTPSNLPTTPLFLIVVCGSGRSEGKVYERTEGDRLYVAAAVTGVTDAIVVGHLS
jgi:hypothetical protein